MSQEIESKTKMTDCPDPEDYSLCSHFIDAFGIIHRNSCNRKSHLNCQKYK